MTKIKTYKEYKEYAIKKLIEKGKEFSFEKVDDRFHYVYRITNLLENKHYYGSRSSKELDIGIKYFTSSKDISFKKDFKTNTKNYKVKIIKIFDNKWDKQIYESFLHQYFNVKKSEKFYNNVNQLPNGRDTTGMVSCIDKEGNKHFITKDEFDSRDDLSSITKNNNKNCIFCYDTNNNYFWINKDVFNNRDDLTQFHTKGEIYVKDINTGFKFKTNKQELLNNDNLVSVNKGIKHTKKRSEEHCKKISINNKGRKRTEEQKRNQSIKLKGRKLHRTKEWQDKINESNSFTTLIYNEYNQLVNFCITSFREFCDKNNYPYISFCRSVGLLYNDASKSVMSRLKNNGNIKYKNWRIIKINKKTIWRSSK